MRRPSPALIIAIIALVFALTGGAVSAKKLSLGKRSNGAKNKTVGVGKLTYVQTTANIPRLRKATSGSPPPICRWRARPGCA